MDNNPQKPNFDSQENSKNSINSLIQEKATESNAIQIPEISLPKGGGALKGIDEKFEVNAANGTAAFNIPLPVTSGRNGFSPSLTLSYNSGGGNSSYGLGWAVDYPSIQRKTDKRLPRYRDGSEDDIFMFSGAEDLVPFLTEENPGEWQEPDSPPGDYEVKKYRPRIEGGFARIEKISHPGHGVYWKVTTRENVATIFGRSANTRIVDPEDETRIFQWLPEFSYDDKGNWIKYECKAENLEDVDNEPHENNRIKGTAKFTNRYLKRIRYGNRKPYYTDPAKPYDPQSPIDDEHLFELVYDYGEHDALVPTPNEVPEKLWEYRPDAFSSYRAGFEIRTNRLCKRVLMFHHFKDEPRFGENYLVRSLDFEYEPSSINNSGQTEVTYLKSITQTGYIKKADGTYSKKSLPPMEFDYQCLNWNTEIKVVNKESIANAPVGLTNNYQWVDLYGEGISGILTEQGEGWYYKNNFGDVDEDGDVTFAPAQKVIPKPSFTGLSTGVLSIQDIEANGQKQVVVNSPGVQGYFELTYDNDWEPFQSFEEMANIDLRDPNVRLIDLNGDGQPELVVTEENVFVWYAANGKKGYKAAEFATKSLDEEKGPSIVFADQEQAIFLADMSGDGLTDIVRIRNSEICYWANMGYGCFSAKINMSNAPLFDHPDLFNPQYLYLADVSGTGATDIVYLGKNTFKAFINLSGNAWSDAHEIEPFCPVDSNSQLSVIDLLGRGTSCIVWSSDLLGYAETPMRYIDLMNSKKPHVLVHHKNNFGKETTIEYKSSTHFYLQDKLDGKPWITKLPFPVQVVSKLIVEEKITNVRFANEYRYHHGYYDHSEREFRGFGMVEQIDTEFYESWQVNNAGTHLEQSEKLYQKPVLIKTWFHTGAFIDKECILSQFKDESWHKEYNREFPDSPLAITEPVLKDAQIIPAETIQDNNIIDKLSGDEWREVLRACKGMVLRQEVFALDAPEGATDEEIKKQLKPYTVATHNCNIQILQPRENNPYGVLMVTENEAITLNYERDEAYPRIAHTLNTKLDDLGNIIETASVVYPRLQDDASLPQKTREEQKKTLITYTRNAYTNDIDLPSAYRLRLIAETETFEITGLAKTKSLYQLTDFQNILTTGSDEIQYHEQADSLSTQRRKIEHIRTLYYKDNLATALPFGELDSKGINYESYQLAYTPLLLSHLFNGKIADQNVTMSNGKFVHSEGDVNWWIRSGVVQFIDKSIGENVNAAKVRFYSPISYTDPFGSITKVSYYKDYFLFMEETEDALQNRINVEQFNFRTLTPRQMRDINDNLSEVLVDELGLVKAVALQGKDLNNDGIAELEVADDLNGLEEITENEAVDIQAFFQSEDSVELDTIGRNLLQHATSRFVYDFETYRNQGKPVVVAAITRETHHAYLAAGEQTKLQFSFEYSNGLGNVAMTKAQAEPGLAKKVAVQADGSYIVTEEDTAALDPKRLRWVGNGRMVLNNKGNPVKQYEPYFSVTPHYEDAKKLVETGVTPILYYDSLGRLIKTELPDKTFTKVKFDAWKQTSYDQNDTVKDSQWYTDRINNLIIAELIAAGKDPAKEKEAAQKSDKHHGTPITIHLDTLGRPILSIAFNRDLGGHDELYNTIVELDIEGNARKVVDARNNEVMKYGYDILGHRVYQNSMDAGKRWMLNNVMGNPVNTWDSRDHIFFFAYDDLQRPSEMKVEGGVGENPLNNIYEKIVYGEGQTDDKLNNLRGQVFEHLDTAGNLQFVNYDLKGNLLKNTRQLTKDYKNVVNWNNPNPDDLLETEAFTSEFKYDAMNRVTWSKTPDNSITEPGYNEANLLETVSVTQNSSSELFVKNIDYDEKGQRKSITYGNDVTTTYQYDEETFRLLHLQTKRANDDLLQDLYYTFDPVGNITEIEDRCIPTVFYDNHKIEPKSKYNYDPLYRLIEAEGKEHIAQTNFGGEDNWNDLPFLKQYSTGDPMAWRKYTQKYTYDPVGNIEQMQHIANGGSWTRMYQYEAANNRLRSTRVGNDNYTYPHHAQHGFIEAMPHLQVMAWNFKDELQAVAKQRRTDGGTPKTTYYVYDSDGQRVRKVTENTADPENDPVKKNERIYVDGIEVYRDYQDDGDIELERETLHVMDDTRRIVMVETLTQTGDSLLTRSFRRLTGTTGAKLVRYQFSNHLGTACLETDDDTNVISYEEYHPFGTTAYQAVNKEIKVSAKRYKYTGKERDEESGFYYYGARYYISWLGRWLSTDPQGLVDGLNIYQAFQHNPINLKDLNGFESVGELIEQKALQACKEERYVSGYLWSLLDVTWSVFGAEGVSKVTADPKKASAGDYLSAGIEVVSVIPVGKIAKAGKGLIVAKEVAKEGAEKVVKEGAEKVVKEGAEKVVKEGAEKLTKEGTEKVVKESTEKVTKEAAPVLAKEAAEQALKKELSQFTRAAEFGIQEYGALQKALKGTGLHAHHLIEQRFAKILKVSRSKMKAIALTPAEHQIFTNRWREAIGYIGSKNPLTTATAKPEHIRAMARKIYEDYPQILKQLGL
jgi:RHS repeat-associated protein